MSLQSRIESLKQRHSALDARVTDEDHRPRPNQETVSKLKGQKLKLKDEMETLSARCRGAPQPIAR